MTDILIDNEDFKFIQSNSEEFDIALSEKDEIYNLVRRAVQTPLEYIGRYIVDSKGLRGIDYQFGDAIYAELSEGFTISLVARVKDHVQEAISQITADNRIQNIDVFIPDFNTLDIQIHITGLEEPIKTRIDI